MSRILGIDFGTKRVGLAVTDTLQIAAHGLTSLLLKDAIDYIRDYTVKEPVDLIVIGMPENPGKQFSVALQNFVETLNETCPGIPVVYEDEDFTSAEAISVIRMSGAKKKDRRNKTFVDQVSAILILQRYLGHQN